MEAKSPKIGRYLILDSYNELHNGKLCPVANVMYMEFGWSKFSNKIGKIRLRSLYNESSEGPKLDYPIHNLYQHYLLINDMYVTTDPNNLNKTNYSVLWSVERPSNYDQIIQEEKEIEGDFLLIDEALHKLERLALEEILSDEADLQQQMEVRES
jgi:hypothetical protein